MQVIRYRANDGSEWKSEVDCRSRNSMIAEVDVAMSVLKATPDTCNWEGYVQQDASSVRLCREMLFEIANRDGVLKWWIDMQKKEHGKTDGDFIYSTHASWFGRMLDGNHDPLGRAYWRLCAIDAENREWNQPYYAMNPGAGQMVRVG